MQMRYGDAFFLPQTSKELLTKDAEEAQCNNMNLAQQAELEKIRESGILSEFYRETAQQKIKEKRALKEHKLSSKERNALPSSDFAEPGERKYPIPDKSHARNAISRVSANGTPAEKKKVRSAVHSKYPDIGEKQESTRVFAKSIFAEEEEMPWMKAQKHSGPESEYGEIQSESEEIREDREEEFHDMGKDFKPHMEAEEEPGQEGIYEAEGEQEMKAGGFGGKRVAVTGVDATSQEWDDEKGASYEKHNLLFYEKNVGVFRSPKELEKAVSHFGLPPMKEWFAFEDGRISTNQIEEEDGQKYLVDYNIYIEVVEEDPANPKRRTYYEPSVEEITQLFGIPDYDSMGETVTPPPEDMEAEEEMEEGQDNPIVEGENDHYVEQALEEGEGEHMMEGDKYFEEADFTGFGNRELNEASILLRAYVTGDLPPDFDAGGDIKIGFNKNSGHVFIINEEFQVLMEDGGKLYMFYNSPYEGREGSFEDLKAEYPEMHPEDQEWFRSIAEMYGQPIEGEEEVEEGGGIRRE